MKKQASRRAADAAPPTTATKDAPDRATRLLSSLGLHGLAHLDAPVLAALATETPMLLIGPHGCAKSALLERLAAAMGLEHRHYNASLLSFDDLVGFPVPDGDGLRYLRTPATLWGAQSVFLDEISRCRPEVQNKLFSIVHERRVQGVALGALRYRWAAMNPPAGPESADAGDSIADSALVALRHSLPHRAQRKPVDAGVVASVHRQAVDAASQVQADAALARVLDKAHPVKRVGLALAAVAKSPGRVPRHTMSLLVADALASQDKQARWILSQELLPTLVELDCVDAPTLELLAEPFTAQVSFEERPNLRHEVPRSRIAPFNALVATVGALDAED